MHAFGVRSVVEKLRADGAASAAGLAAAALVLGGCGGGAKPATTHGPLQLTAEERQGRAVFVRSCGSCHTLADAGTHGMAGPDLDGQPTNAAHVREVVADGPGLMPAGLVRGADADAVAAYVAAATH